MRLSTKYLLLAFGGVIMGSFLALTVSPISAVVFVLVGMWAEKCSNAAWQEQHPLPRPPLKVVIAGNYQQYRDFLRLHHLNGKLYHYYTRQNIMGLHNPEVHLWGEYWKSEAYEYARQMGWVN